MSKLIQLPDGNWTKARYVQYVEAMDRAPSIVTCPEIPPRVIVHVGLAGDEQYRQSSGGTDRRVIECKTFGEAIAMRDHIALLINEALAEEKSDGWKLIPELSGLVP